MNIEHLLIQSLQLLGLGMGAVFVILILLIAIVSLVSKLVPPTPVNSIQKRQSSINNDHIVALSVAIHQYRNRR